MKKQTVVNKSIENINKEIQGCIKKLSTKNDISRDQANSIVKKVTSFNIPNVIEDKDAAEYYAKKLLEINFLENVKQIFREIFSKQSLSVDDLKGVREEMRITCFKINSLRKFLKEKGIEIWGDYYPIRINLITLNNSYIVE